MASLAWIALPLLCWLLPGFALSRALWPEADWSERLATALLLGLVSVCAGTYLVAWTFADAALSRGLVLGVAAAIGLGALPFAWRGSERGAGAFTAALVLIASTSALVSAPNAVRAPQFFEPCSHMSAMYLIEGGEGAALRAWDPELGAAVTHLFSTEQAARPESLRPVLADQRPGSAATFVQPLLFAGSAGVVLCTFVYELLLLLFMALLLRRQLPSELGAALIATALLVGAKSIAGFTVNENVLAAGLGAACWWALGAKPRRQASVLAGLAFGWCVATRPVALVFLPAVLVLLRRRGAAPFAVAALGPASAALITHWQLFDSPLAHPSLRHATTLQHFAGFEFRFHPLNFPVHEALVRPAYEPFPLLFQTPLELLQAYGAALWALALLGFVAAPPRRRLAIALWGAPLAALLLLIVSLDHAKLSYALLALVPLAELCGRGLAWLRSARIAPHRRAALAMAGVALLFVLPLPLQAIELPVDTRPHHNDEDAGRATPKQLSARRAQLLDIALWPRPRFLLGWNGPLLAHAAPLPVADGLLRGPVYLQRGHERSVHAHFEVAPSPAPQISPALGTFSRTPDAAWQHAALSAQVPGSRVAVTVDYDLQRLEVDVQTLEAGSGGWVDLGLAFAPLHLLENVVLRIDGVEQPLHYLVLEARYTGPEQALAADYHGGARQSQRLRLASNRVFRLRPDGGAFVVEPGYWPELPCDVLELWAPGVDREIGAAAGVWREDTEDWALRMRYSPRYPPGPAPDCRHIDLRHDIDP